MTGGAWLVVDGVRVDLCYRELGPVERWCAGELALGRVLAGTLPCPGSPAARVDAVGDALGLPAWGPPAQRGGAGRAAPTGRAEPVARVPFPA